LDGGTALGSADLTNGTATFSISSLATGVHSILASYSGDANYRNSSAMQTQTVKANTTTILTGSPNPSTVGQSLIFTATVLASGATGTVTFFDGSSTMGTAKLSGGSAMCGAISSSCSTSSLGQGSHSIKAAYSGDSSNEGSSAAWTQIVRGATTITLISSPNPFTAGQAVILTATVSPCCIATGTVTFFDGSSTLGTGTLAFSQGFGGITATLAPSSLSAGSHSITASYGGDNSDNGSTSAILMQVVRPNTAIAINSTPNPSIVGQSVTFTATVSPSTATGTVTFLDGRSALITNLPMSGGKATFSVPNFTAGTHPVTATYSGDSSYGGSTSGVLTQTVNAH
jgi:hypothetical protein